jgi:hypothetical protein
LISSAWFANISKYSLYSSVSTDSYPLSMAN